MGALDALDDHQSFGLAVGLASLGSLVSLYVHEQQKTPPLTRPAAVASRLSLLLHGTTNLKDLRLWGLKALDGQPPVRPAPDPLPLPRFLAAAAAFLALRFRVLTADCRCPRILGHNRM